MAFEVVVELPSRDDGRLDLSRVAQHVRKVLPVHFEIKPGETHTKLYLQRCFRVNLQLLSCGLDSKPLHIAFKWPVYGVFYTELRLGSAIFRPKSHFDAHLITLSVLDFVPATENCSCAAGDSVQSVVLQVDLLLFPLNIH